MVRNRVMTTLGILLSCTLAFNGFFMMQRLLGEKEENVLSQKGTIPVVEADRKGTKFFPKTKLKKEELIQVLKSMESRADEEPHDPFGQELSMKQAIAKGKQWMVQFYGKYIGTMADEFETFEKITATLCKKKLNIANQSISDELYSYWTVDYIAEDMKAQLFINAVTGQVLKTSVTTRPYSILDMENLIKSYAESFSLDSKYTIVNKEDNAVYIFTDEIQVCAMLSTDRFKTNVQADGVVEEKEVSITLDLYLSTN